MSLLAADDLICLYDSEALEAHRLLRTHVMNATRSMWGERGGKPVTLIKWAQGAMIGSACGIVCPGWLCLELLWVEEQHRSKGTGSNLLQQVEQKAVELGAHSAYLWTQEFEAPNFYLARGYREFATLQEFGPGHQLIGMQKKLA